MSCARSVSPRSGGMVPGCIVRQHAETVPFLSMANGSGTKLGRMTVLHCALVFAKMFVSVLQNAERSSFGKRISLLVKEIPLSRM